MPNVIAMITHLRLRNLPETRRGKMGSRAANRFGGVSACGTALAFCCDVSGGFCLARCAAALILIKLACDTCAGSNVWDLVPAPLKRANKGKAGTKLPVLRQAPQVSGETCIPRVDWQMLGAGALIQIKVCGFLGWGVDLGAGLLCARGRVRVRAD